MPSILPKEVREADVELDSFLFLPPIFVVPFIDIFIDSCQPTHQSTLKSLHLYMNYYYYILPSKSVGHHLCEGESFLSFLSQFIECLSLSL